MRSQSLATHTAWSVVVELVFSSKVSLRGSRDEAYVHYFDADEIRWETVGPGRELRLRLFLRGESVTACAAERTLQEIRLLAVPPPGSRARARWLPHEIRRLREELARGTSTSQIARMLGRTPEAVDRCVTASPELGTVQMPIPYPRAGD